MKGKSSCNIDSKSLIEDFLKNGGKISKIAVAVSGIVRKETPSSKKKKSNVFLSNDKPLTVTRAHSKELNLHSLSEAMDLYGEKRKTLKKKKTVNVDKLKDVNRDLIPEELQHIFDKAK